MPDPDTDSDNYRVFADGGLWANNPVLVALIDALNCAAPDQTDQIFSIGNVSRPAGSQIHRRRSTRMLSWKLGAEIGPLAIDVQEIAYDHMPVPRGTSPSSPIGPACRLPQEEAASTMLKFLSLDESATRGR